jgi:hypothetical protein
VHLVLSNVQPDDLWDGPRITRPGAKLECRHVRLYHRVRINGLQPRTGS